MIRAEFIQSTSSIFTTTCFFESVGVVASRILLNIGFTLRDAQIYVRKNESISLRQHTLYGKQILSQPGTKNREITTEQNIERI